MPLLPKLPREFRVVMNVVKNQQRARASEPIDRRNWARIGVFLNFSFQVEIEDRVFPLVDRHCRSESKSCLPDRCHVYAAGPTMRLQLRQQLAIGSKGRYLSVEIFLTGWKWVIRSRKVE